MNPTLQALLTRLVDYAGLFPPAGLTMDDAVANYARYREGDHRWMLARFITPVARLQEFEASASKHFSGRDEWALSVLPGTDVEADMEVIAAFNHRNRRQARIDTIEARADSVEGIAKLDEVIPDDIALFIEIPAAPDDPDPLVAAIADAGRFAKIRTGGVKPEAYPSMETIIRFVRRCHEHDTPFKATAGLHHPLRCVKPLTYASDAPLGTMNGFINLFLAAAALRKGSTDTTLVELLSTEDPTRFSLEGETISWGQTTIDVAELASTRRELAISFGSCSFEEPIDDLRALQWID